MRFITTKRGVYELMDDIRGLAVAVSNADINDYVEFDKPASELADSEVIARINALYEN